MQSDNVMPNIDKEADSAGWDPYQVWYQRVLQPRLTKAAKAADPAIDQALSGRREAGPAESRSKVIRQIESHVNSITYAAEKKSDPCQVDIHEGDSMGAKQGINSADTYVLDDDVMDEMENVEATVVLPNAPKHSADADTDDDGFLEDAEAATVVLNNRLPDKG